jgi:hypothetical protein
MGSQGNGIGCNGHAKGFHGKDSEGSGVGYNSHAKTMPRKCEGMPMGYTAMPRSAMAIPCHVLARQCQEFPKTFFQKFSKKKNK